MLLNDDTLNIEKFDVLCSPTFLRMIFQDYFYIDSFFIKDSRYA